MAPAINSEGGQRPAFVRASQNAATRATLLDTLPAPSADGVDMLYRQLRGNPRHRCYASGRMLPLASGWGLKPKPGPLKASWHKTTTEPSMVGMTSLPASVSSQGPSWQLGQRPQECRQTCHGDMAAHHKCYV
jgi:hypothetical protein